MKKIISILAAIALLCTVTACGSSGAETQTTTDQETTTAETVAETASETETDTAFQTEETDI